MRWRTRLLCHPTKGGEPGWDLHPQGHSPDGGPPYQWKDRAVWQGCWGCCYGVFPLLLFDAWCGRGEAKISPRQVTQACYPSAEALFWWIPRNGGLSRADQPAWRALFSPRHETQAWCGSLAEIRLPQWQGHGSGFSWLLVLGSTSDIACAGVLQEWDERESCVVSFAASKHVLELPYQGVEQCVFFPNRGEEGEKLKHSNQVRSAHRQARLCLRTVKVTFLLMSDAPSEKRWYRHGGLVISS